MYANKYIFYGRQEVSMITVKTLGSLVISDLAFSKLAFKNLREA